MIRSVWGQYFQKEKIDKKQDQKPVGWELQDMYRNWMVDILLNCPIIVAVVDISKATVYETGPPSNWLLILLVVCWALRILCTDHWYNSLWMWGPVFVLYIPNIHEFDNEFMKVLFASNCSSISIKGLMSRRNTDLCWYWMMTITVTISTKKKTTTRCMISSAYRFRLNFERSKLHILLDIL